MVSQRSNAGGFIGGAILIGLGLLFLAGQFISFATWANLLPLVVMGVGVVFFVGMVAGGPSAAPLAIPGSIISTVGLVLLFQNLTGHWETWSYGWTIIITAVGLGLYISGLWSGNPHQRRSGLRVTGIGFVLFVVFGGFFELVLSGWGGWRTQQLLFPILLIGLGLFLVLRRTNLWPAAWFGNQNPPVEAAPRPPEPPAAQP